MAYNNIRAVYAKINQQIKLNIERKNVNIKELIDKYEKGMSDGHIRIIYKLNEEEMGYILRNNLTPRIIKNRQETIRKLDTFKMNMMGLKNEDVDNSKLTLQDAIDLVEGNNDR